MQECPQSLRPPKPRSRVLPGPELHRLGDLPSRLQRRSTLKIANLAIFLKEAFWFFVSLVENVLPLDYYSSLEGVLVDQRIFTCLIEIQLPEIAKKLRDCNLDCSAFSIPWFVCVFSRTLNAKLFQIAMDNLVIQGSLALFKVGIAVLKLLEEQILKAPDFRRIFKGNCFLRFYKHIY